MGNNNVTPMTRDELRKARFPSNFVEDITKEIWHKFGEMQREEPDLKTWRVVIPIDIDKNIHVSKSVCKNISKQIKNDFVNEDYPYNIMSVDLCKVQGEYHIACIFQEEGSDTSDLENPETPQQEQVKEVVKEEQEVVKEESLMSFGRFSSDEEEKIETDEA